MRPLRLDMAGFTVFRDETTIDFTDVDFFALTGPTGSGKSTVLDAICFALYGQVPRWASSRGIVNALAPSATEARVRLVFESAGARYVATRVVRRDGKGRVSTGGAGLQLMPRGFDPSKLDTGLTPEDLGEVLAGTPGEMDAAVLEAVGLPYEQFTSCVVLPQGQFADFLHAKPAARQEILVNLLGLHVYEAIQKKASARAVQADAQLAAVDQLLGDLSDADDESLEATAARLAAMRELATAVEADVPALREAEQGAEDAATALKELGGEIDALAAIRPPDDHAAVAEAVATARATATEAAAAVAAAEESEEKVRGQIAGAPDVAALRLLLEAHAEYDKLTGQAQTLAEAVRSAKKEHGTAATALDKATADATAAAQKLEEARRAYQEAQHADRAAALRVHLAVGAPCPVCEQPVTTVPDVAASAVAAAEAAGKVARKEADKATQLVAERDKALRELDRVLERARAQHDQLTARLAELAARLADSPGPVALGRELEARAVLQGRLDDAAGAVRAAREAQRRAQSGADAADERLRSAWRRFDKARDAVGRLGPPAADRDDLVAAWTTLAEWAAAQGEERAGRRDDAVARLDAARAAVTAIQERLATLFVSTELAVPEAGLDGAGASRAVAVAVARAEGAHQRVIERREQAERLREQRVEYEREGNVAKTLAGHLRANNFERWLLEEALDLLVDGASRILRELSGGQYELVHDKGEFYVVDHHDAGLRRGVRTLSGGETFQASLALALALSEQLAGLSTTSASLESIVLDEGFGTLDAATLDTVAATLEGLAARGDRMVGVVTHVPSLAERVPVRFEVRKDARTARVERVGL
ncbi:AAA family ATPase [Phytohabitans kaempferiae]|uniref:Nuclease SbcCD subunit C n=1 Tax=Phytohabitans kaempferiae TaxID=1620943 RepID=A0ABV6M8M0_9ACTN